MAANPNPNQSPYSSSGSGNPSMNRRSSYASVVASGQNSSAPSAFTGTAPPLPGLAGPGIGSGYSGGTSRFGYGTRASGLGPSGGSSGVSSSGFGRAPMGSVGGSGSGAGAGMRSAAGERMAGTAFEAETTGPRSVSRPISRSQASAAVDDAVQIAPWAQRGPANSSSTSLPPYSGGATTGGLAGSVSSSPFNGNGFAGMAMGDFLKDGFFIPSYLRGSKYTERLEAQHRARILALRDADRGEGGAFGRRGIHGGSLSTHSSSANLHKMGGYGNTTHRGISVEVTERNPPFSTSPGARDIYSSSYGHSHQHHYSAAFPSTKSKDSSMPHVDPLPTRLSSEMKAPTLELHSYQSYPNLEVRLAQTSSSRPSHDDAASVRADQPIPRAVGIYYFEVTVVGGSRSRSEGLVSVGLTTTQAPLNRLPGWESESWAYHGDDGAVFASSSNGRPFGPKFTNGDVVGVGIIWREKGGDVFFTKNGTNLGVTFQGIKPTNPLYPSVGVKKPGEAVRLNFGQFPFVFDIDSEVHREQSLLASDIFKTSTSDLSPKTTETILIQQLISQYLAHEGYVETARAFTHEVEHESRTLSSGGTSDGGVPVIEEDVNAVHRQRIRTAVLTGDIDRAIKLTRAFYPQVLESNENIYFKLKCRKFVEMIRAMTEAAQQSQGSPKSVTNGTNGTSNSSATEQNGHSHGYPPMFPADSDDEAMEDVDEGVDSTGASPNPSTVKSSSKGLPKGDLELLQEALRFGQDLRAEWSKDPRREVQQALEDTLALIAYTNPTESPLRGLLGNEGREVIAEELGGCILVSLGKSSTAALEKMVAHTEALVDMIAEDGVPGALVNVRRDFLRDL